MGVLNITIDDEIHVNFKIKCIRKNIDMKDQVETLIKKWLKED